MFVIKLVPPEFAWSTVEIDTRVVLEEMEASYLREQLHKEGIETKPTPFGFEANIIKVRHKDFPRTKELIERWRGKPYQERRMILKTFKAKLESVI